MDGNEISKSLMAGTMRMHRSRRNITDQMRGVCEAVDRDVSGLNTCLRNLKMATTGYVNAMKDRSEARQQFEQANRFGFMKDLDEIDTKTEDQMPFP